MDIIGVADIPVTIRVVRRGTLYGYEITIRDGTLSGWSTPAGIACTSPSHAWKAALHRARNQGLRLTGMRW